MQSSSKVDWNLNDNLNPQINIDQEEWNTWQVDNAGKMWRDQGTPTLYWILVREDGCPLQLVNSGKYQIHFLVSCCRNRQYVIWQGVIPYHLESVTTSGIVNLLNFLVSRYMKTIKESPPFFAYDRIFTFSKTIFSVINTLKVQCVAFLIISGTVECKFLHWN
jgi:hypothetical protein